MSRVFKTLLLWLIIGVLPLQALAGVTLASCSANEHAGVPVAAQQHAHEAAASNACDDHHAAAQHPQSGGAADPHSATDHRHNNAIHASCHVSMACCVGAVAPPSAAFALSAYRVAETVTTSSAVLPVGYVPATPKRPPRSIFA